MKLEKIGLQEGKNINFRNRRLFKNTVEQLSKNNPYSLTLPNQRYIANSIKELGKIGDLKSVNFLLNVAAESKYSTNIVLQDAPKNNWKAMLVGAAATAAALFTSAIPDSVQKKIQEIMNNKELNKDEQDILNLREQLLAVVDLEQINNETKGPLKNFKKNLDYLIISSETTLEHKKYILERLNYFMSDKYEINPQLKDKKSIAIAEMVNDMAISVPGNDIPNIKAVNQKQHGMCAAISIVRKKLAYEDKPNYVDAIISELDASDSVTAYDRNALGTGKKVSLEKVYVDFEAAMKNGYRIIDASTMHWMQIAHMTGANNIAYKSYNPFDRENFGVKADTFLNAQLENEELANIQNYYQALLISKSLVESFKSSQIKETVTKEANKNSRALNQKILVSTQDELKSLLKINLPNLSQKDIRKLHNELLSLEKITSNKIRENKFAYLPNEESSIKQEKIKSFILEKTKTLIDSKNIEKIFNLIDSIIKINKTMGNNNNNSKQGRLTQAKKLFEIAAAHRNQVILSLEEYQTLESIMLNYKLPSKERLVLEHIDNLIQKLETDSVHSDLIISQIHPAFQGLEPTKEDMIDGLYALKAATEKIITQGMDEVYDSLTSSNKKDVLINYINEIINEIKNGNNKCMKSYAEVFDVKKNPDTVIKTLNNLIEKVATGDEKDYAKNFEKLGHISQVKYMHAIFNKIKEQIEAQEPENEEEQESKTTVLEQMNNIEERIIYFDTYFDTCAESLRIYDSEGDVLYSAVPKDVIIKKSEQKGNIASAKELRELQSHFEKVAEDRSSDEFQSRQGNLKNKKLYKFSKSEQKILNETEKNINSIYSYIQKGIAGIRKDKKNEWEELNRAIGLNNGSYWIHEGHSGLYSQEQVRILEYMTGRPHYINENMKEVIEKIKTEPYSGISGSSVFHDKSGFHAQYIADIKPVEVNVKDSNGKIKTETKDVLFQDNTWGASEQENTWVDSWGLTRTDYSDNRGGALGYITNNNYQNGNFVDKILNEMPLVITNEPVDNKVYKKINGSDTSTRKMPQYYDAIVDGISPETKTISNQIHDAFLVSNANYIKPFSDIAKDLTLEEIEAKIQNIEKAENDYKTIYEELKKRIFPVVGKGISTEEEYNKLANDDYLKVALEKTALKERSETKEFANKLATVKNVKDLSRFKAAQTKRALDIFRYIFRKDPQILEFVGDEASGIIEAKLEKILQKYSIELSDKDYYALGKNFKINADKFDGSAKKTIELMMEELDKNIHEIIKNDVAAKEISELYRNYFQEQVYFNKSDLDMSLLKNQKHSHIIKFIDRVFDPVSDEEFVEIFRKIQDMTFEEFNREVMPNVEHKDLGIKTVTGFDILKRIRNYEEKANTDFLNTVFYDSLVETFEKEDNSYRYSYDKFSRKSHMLRTFDFTSLYRDFSADLSLLRMPKIFNKYKGQNLETYDAYPAYPTPDYLSDEYLNRHFSRVMESINQNVKVIKDVKNQIETYEIANELHVLAQRSKDREFLTENDLNKLTILMGKFITYNMNDQAMGIAVSEAHEVLDKLDKNITIKEYLPHIYKIVKIVQGIENLASTKDLKNLLESKKLELDVDKKVYATGAIQPKYANKITELLNKYETALKKNRHEEAEELSNRIFNLSREYHILQDEKALLKEFLKTQAKDSKTKEYNTIYEQILKHGLEQSKLAEVQYIIMDALSQGLALNAKSQFNEHLLQTGHKMGEDGVICGLVNDLIDGTNVDTALLFIEKMGLGETYVNFMKKNYRYEHMHNTIKEGFELATNFTKFQDILEPHFAYIETNLRNPDFPLEKEINKLIKHTKNYGKQFNINKDALNILISGYETFKINMHRENTQIEFLYHTIISSSKTKCAEAIESIMLEKDNVLNSGLLILNLINRILLPIDSEATKNREFINNKFQELYQYKESLANLQENQ